MIDHKIGIQPIAEVRNDSRFRRRRLDEYLADYGIVIITGVLFVALAVSNDRFMTRTNLLNIIDQQAALGIMACAITFTMIAGGFDLSIAAVYALAAVVTTKVAVDYGPLWGLAVGVPVGLAVGALNGVLVTVGRVQSFIATLATSIVARGVALVVTGGFVITVSDEAFGVLGTERFMHLRYPGWVFLAVAALAVFVLHCTTYGRHVFAVGGNAEAARLSGIRVNAVRFSTFLIAGGAAGLAGLLDASRVSSAQAGIGVGMELTAIAAVVIGGTSIMGGEGAIWRTLSGVAFLALVGNGFNIMGINPVYQQIFNGVLILTAISLGAWARRSQ